MAKVRHSHCGSLIFAQEIKKSFAVIWSFGHLVKIVFKCQNPPLYINILYLYIVSEMTESENENDHFDLDHFDHFFANCVRRLSVSIEDSELTRQNVVSGQIAYICAVL